MYGDLERAKIEKARTKHEERKVSGGHLSPPVAKRLYLLVIMLATLF